VISQALKDRFYRGERYDGTKLFYDWIRQHTGPETVLLNLGAGPATGQVVRNLKGRVAKVVGADIDPDVLGNAELDEAHVLTSDLLPFPDQSFDVVLSDYVLEHVEHPRGFLSEVNRVLRPGGRFFFRTPNRSHYVALISRATPHWFHELVANRVRGRGDHDHAPYPTFYRMNSVARLRRTAEACGFSSSDLRLVEMEPSYLMISRVLFLGGVAYERLVNHFDALAPLRANIFGCLVK